MWNRRSCQNSEEVLCEDLSVAPDREKRFHYKSEHYYEAIKQMHLLQEEYLLIVNNDVHSFIDLFHLINELQKYLKEVEA